ncbi:MAG: peptidylprolyl isomerase [Anaerolineales bacterium]|nr:peptidylprolyl isomerase [Anaerolineales bacterium]
MPTSNEEKPKVKINKHVARLERERRQSAIIRNIAIAVVTAVILLIAYGYIDQTYLQAQKPVARVGETKITVSQFQGRVRLERQSMINQYFQMLQLGQSFGMDMASQLQPIEDRMSDPYQFGQDVLDTMINELLYKQEALRRGITISEDVIEKDIQGFLKYYPDGTPTPVSPSTAVPTVFSTLSPEQLALVTITPTPTEAPTLTPFPTATPDTVSTATATAAPTDVPLPTLTPTPYTYKGYQEEYQTALDFYTASGVSEEDFRFLFEAQAYYEALYDIVTADTPATGEEVWVRHILVGDLVTANVIREKILNGEDFSTLAADVSQDPGSSANGGDVGWFGRGMMVLPFEEAAFALENIGDVSEPVQTDFGYHIIQLLGRREAPLDASAYQNAKDEVFQAWLEELRANSDFEIYDIWQSIVPTEPDLQQAINDILGGQPQPVQ